MIRMWTDRYGVGLALRVAVLCGWAVAAAGDVLVVGTKEHKGTFEGFQNGAFLFRTAGGDELREARAGVRSLTLDKPKAVDWMKVNGHESERAQLVGYERARFVLKQGGQEQAVPGMHVRSITVDQPPAAQTADVSKGVGPIPRLDIAWLDNAQLTEPQARALAQYKTARRAYERFLAESSSLVARMDRATGEAREQLLTQLRGRKAAEQPIVAALVEAEKGMYAQFPPDKQIPMKPAAASTGGAADAARTPAEPAELPDAGDDQVVLIDVSGLEAMPALTDVQKAVVSDYRALVETYRALCAKPVAAEQADAHNAELRRMAGKLKQALTKVMQAFPGLRFADR